MNRSSALIFPFALALTLTLISASAQAETSVRRFALIVGMNDGGKERVQLRYAELDAQAMSRVLEDLGGVAGDDRTLLLGADKKKVAAALQAFGERMKDAKAPGALRQMIFYYSGHSDEEGLLLGTERVSYSELRKMIADVGADIQIAILDSCSSGALVRAKGGKARPPFLVDESVTARGHVFLTSSSEDEVAQESDRIGGSFFTHYLISGLRGAADTTRDGRVTLNEAYQYAFDETLRRTEQSSGGPQHAAYDIQLAGTGDLVMTDLRTSTAGLVIGPKLEGRFYVRDNSGRLVAELFKARGRAAELALEPGVYQVTLQTQDALLAATLTIETSKKAELSTLEPVTAELAQARGGKLADPTDPRKPPLEEAPWVPFSVSVVPAVTSNGAHLMSTNIALDLIWGSYAKVEGAHISDVVAQAKALDGVQMSGALAWVDGDLFGMQMAGAVNYAGGHTEGVQMSGAVNIAGELDGLQMGVVNIGGDTRGMQIGLVNIATHFHGLRLGLFNYSEETKYRVSGWASETEPFSLGFRMIDGPLYTIFIAGMRTLRDDGTYTVGGGLGLALDAFDPLELDFDTSVFAVHQGSMGFESNGVIPVRLRAIANLHLLEHFAVFAGATATIAVSVDDTAALDAYAPAIGWKSSANGKVRIWPGFVLGVEI